MKAKPSEVKDSPLIEEDVEGDYSSPWDKIFK